MKNISIEFSKYESVNFLWPELIEQYGCEKAKKIVSQAIDLQKMNGTEDATIPIIFSGTGGLALISTELIKDLASEQNFNENQVIIFNPKKRLFQLLNNSK